MRLISKVVSLAVLALIISSVATTVCASTTYYVYIRSIPSGLHGHVDGSYWIGQIPISIGTTSQGAASGQQTYAYCMNYTKEIHPGTTYATTLTNPPDNAAWKSISYILTWYNPPTSNDGAVASQVAIWQLLKGSSYSKPSWLTTADNTLGTTLATAAAGKDVIRQTDTLTWVAPAGLVDNGAVSAKPGDSKYFAVQLRDTNGVGRSGVKITFTASSLITPTDVVTDSNGKAGITINVPSNQPQGSTIDINASTRGTYPVLYLDLTNADAQDLIGMGTSYNLTLDASAVVIAHINMVPEVEMGTLAATSIMGLSFVVWVKRPKKKA